MLPDPRKTQNPSLNPKMGAGFDSRFLKDEIRFIYPIGIHSIRV